MKLIHGDCLVELKKIKENSIDFVYLDLPFGQTACKWDKKIDHHALWIELKRIAKSDRTPFFFSCTTKFGFELFNTAPKGYFRWDLVWEKNRAAGFLNAYRLPMRKHEMVYCFAKKTPEYDVSSHTDKKVINYTHHTERVDDNQYGIKEPKYNAVKNIHKDPLPTSVLPPQEESDCFTYEPQANHELVYCFAKKTPEYNVSSHKELKHQGKDYKVLYTDNVYAGTGSKIMAGKTHKDPLPTSVLPPQEESDCFTYEPQANHELVYCFAKKTPEYDVSSHSEYVEETGRNKEHQIDIYGKKGQKCVNSKTHKDPLPTSVLDIPSSWCKFKNDEKVNHRTAKPVKLMEFLLKYWSKEGDTVLDPTAGSGSMGIACKNMNRKFIGIEMDADIFQIMKDRIENHKPPDKLQEAQP